MLSWHLNSKTLEKMVSRIQSASFDALSVIVLDLFGNTSVRFRQVDDTLSLAVKLPGEGGWHLLGDAVYTPDVTLREQVKMLGCLESILKNRAKIFIPPIPRFAFGSCCSNSTHGTNISTPQHPHHALSEHTRQRHTIIKSLNSTVFSNHKVIDIIHCINDTTDTPHNRIAALKKHTHPDNIHLTPEGYKKIADGIITSAHNMTSKPVHLPTCTTTATKGIEQVYWHGFTITTDYGNKSRATPNSAHRGRGGRHHPTCLPCVNVFINKQ